MTPEEEAFRNWFLANIKREKRTTPMPSTELNLTTYEAQEIMERYPALAADDKSDMSYRDVLRHNTRHAESVRFCVLDGRYSPCAFCCVETNSVALLDAAPYKDLENVAIPTHYNCWAAARVACVMEGK